MITEASQLLKGVRFPVLDHGHVILMDFMGSDADIVQAARTSYQAGTKHVSDDSTLLHYLMRHRHSTPFEMCLDGETRIPTFSQNRAVVKHYTMRQIADAFTAGGKANSWVKLLRIRTVNPKNGMVLRTSIKRAWCTGQKDAFQVSVRHLNRSIVATGNHPFLCEDGVFRPLEDLKVGDRVAMNGLPATSAEVRSAVCDMRRGGKKLAEISDAMGMPSSTVWKIIKAEGLNYRLPRKTGFLKKQAGLHVDPRQIARRMLKKSTCVLCEDNGQHVHHIDENPHNNEIDNLVRLCPKHHKHVHTGSLLKKVFFAEITEIASVGMRDVYDLEVDSEHHCFVAEGFVVHNCEVKLHVRVPMDTWRQWIRHRMASVNEYSTRYSEAIDDAAQTRPGEWRLQATTNRQGSGGLIQDAELGLQLSQRESDFQQHAKDVYRERLACGVAREQARKDLPLSTYTEAIWKIDLHNMFHFLGLRMESHAQKEIRTYATVIGESIVSVLFPESWKAFVDYRLNAMTLHGREIDIVSKMLASPNSAWRTESCWRRYLPEEWQGARCRERDEFYAKLKRLGLMQNQDVV
jgi:thymidylate synthase (FAD)